MKRHIQSLKEHMEGVDTEDALDTINDEIDELLTVVEDNEDFQVKLNAIAEMVNKNRFYAGMVTTSALDIIMTRMDAWEERFIVWEKPRSDTRKLVGKP